MRDMAVSGDDLMKEFGLQPGPRIKDLLNKAFEWVLSDIANRNSKETIITYLRSVDAQS